MTSRTRAVIRRQSCELPVAKLETKNGPAYVCVGSPQREQSTWRRLDQQAISKDCRMFVIQFSRKMVVSRCLQQRTGWITSRVVAAMNWYFIAASVLVPDHATPPLPATRAHQQHFQQRRN